MSDKPAILDYASALSEANRCRALCVLQSQELNVQELLQVLQLPQSTISRHLKVLGDCGWVQSRREGTANIYRFADGLPPEALALWNVVGGQMAETEDSRQDLARLQDVLQARRSRSQEYFSSSASEWDEVRDDLYGRRFDLMGLVGLSDPEWVVGDLGCGTGRLTAALAPFVRQVVAVDGSPAMLEAARERLQDCENVALRSGQLEKLPIRDGELDVATLILALHHVENPQRVLGEARRVLKAGGRLVVVDLLPHDREELREQMGHVWLGFAADQVEFDLRTAGFVGSRIHRLPEETEATGPPLFLATARTPAKGESSEIDFDMLETSDDLTDAILPLSPEDLKKATPR